MTGRDTVLGKIRRALSAEPGDRERLATITTRLKRAPAHVIPRRGQLAAGELADLFCGQAESVMARVTRVAVAEDLPEAISEVLRDHNLPAQIRVGADERLARLPWHRALQIERRSGPSDGHDAVALSHALGAAAETGTLFLASGPDNPTTLNFLPDAHLVVVDARDIRGDYESVWQMVRERYGKGNMPRTVNLITGPSRSADIEQTIILGAHGPQALHIFLVENARTDGSDHNDGERREGTA